MKKSYKIKCITLAIAAVTCFGASVSANEPLNSLAIDNGGIISPQNIAINTMNCLLSMPSAGKMQCYGLTRTIPGYKAEIIVTLQQLDGRWKPLKTWTVKNTENAEINETYYVEAGYSYRLSVTHKAYNSSGKLVESFERYSNIIAYK